MEHDGMMRRVLIIANPSPIVSDNSQNSYTLRQGQAIALQYAAQVLLRVCRHPELVQLLSFGKTSGGDDPTSTTILGCGYGARILIPFVVELSLKALITKHNGDQAPRTHDLTELFNQISSELRDEIIQEFERIKQSSELVESRSLGEILHAHHHDFEGWRYLDSPEMLEMTELETLQCVVSAILTVCDQI